jgi:RNA polymerase sigma factor (sigma-70 family)
MAGPAPPARSASSARSVRSAGSGRTDDDILTELYRKYRGQLLSFALHLTAGDRHQAEDVVQETMVRAWRQAGRLDQAAPSLMPWLATVARRIVIDERRKRLARPAEAGDVMVERASVADETDALLRKIAVAEALKSLSPAHREVLNETILQGRTVNQAAEVLGIPAGTVKSRVYYAVRALRLLMAEHGVTE